MTPTIESVFSCPACGEVERCDIIQGVRDWFFECVDGDWSFAECASCHSLYLDPRLSDIRLLDAYRDYYTHRRSSGSGDSSESSGLRKRLANTAINLRFGTRVQPSFRFPLPGALAKLLVNDRVEARFRYFPRLYPGAYVLDVGCGSGAFMKRIADSGWEAFGVDLDQKAVQQARALGLEVLPGDISAAQQFERQFDAITLSHVIEHVPDMKHVLSQALTLLKDNGFINLEFPNPQCAGRRHFGRFWRGLEAPRHLCLPSRCAIAGLLREAGFRRIEFVDTDRDAHGVNAASLSAAINTMGTWSESEVSQSEEPTFLRVFAWV